MDLITGIPEIDEDHARIITAYETLADPKVYSNTLSRIHAVEEFLLYVTKHLDREERLMRQFNYRDYPLHREAHVNLQTDFIGIIKSVVTGTIHHETALAIFSDIFLTHCREYDVPFASWVLENQKRLMRKRIVL